MSGLSTASLLCQESDETSLEEDGLGEVYLFSDLNDASPTPADDDYVGMLFERETSMGFGRDASVELGNWIKGARLEAITWILQTSKRLGFRFPTAYLSLTYFDGFLSRRVIDSEKHWAIRLLSVACLYVAAKMEECNIPLLTEFHHEQYRFKSEDIQRMELLVLQTLEWKMRFVTPFTFIRVFIKNFCGESPPSDIVTRINQLVFAMAKGINLMKQRPSSIAAAATLVASDQRLTRRPIELKIKSIFKHNSLQAEEIFTSYSMMLNLEKTKLFDSPNLTLLDCSSAIFDASKKRERIKINDHEQKRERKRAGH